MRRIGCGVAAFAVLALTACAGTGHGPTTPVARSVGPGNACHVSSELIPSCGILWAVATVPQSVPVLSSVEASVGRRFDVVYNYHDINDVIPTSAEQQEIGAGKILHLAIAARIYGEPQTMVTYADIAAGVYDAELTKEAEGIASLHTRVFVSFEQEANQRDKLGSRGSASDFRAAWRHLHSLFQSAGATNAVWVWVMTGAPANLDRAGQLWPGNDVVDWISWNVYNQSGCGGGQIQAGLEVSFRDALEPFYDWVHTQGPGLGIDPTKPMMISETGSVLYTDDPERTAAWYAAVPAALSEFSQVKAVGLWDSRTSDLCDYRFQRDPAVLSSVRRVGLSPVVTGRG
jgi:hypothetical protein